MDCGGILPRAFATKPIGHRRLSGWYIADTGKLTWWNTTILFCIAIHPRAGLPTQNLLLTFEDRPVILQPAWIKDAPTENLFFSEPLAHNDARSLWILAADPLLVAAPGPRWAYAGSWRRSDDIWFDQPFLLELKMQVSGASIGLGCVSEDFAAYVTKEIKVDPGSDVQTISLYVESPVAARHLVLRNVDVAAHQALVVIYEFRCFAAAANPLC